MNEDKVGDEVAQISGFRTLSLTLSFTLSLTLSPAAGGPDQVNEDKVED